MEPIQKDINVLMVGSDLSAKGGIVSVIRNLLSYEGWKRTNITFVPTHREGTTVQKICFFAKAFLRIFRLLSRKQYSVLHIHVSERGSFLRKAILLRLAKQKNCRVILHHHGAEFLQYYENSGSGMKKWIQNTMALADLNLILSRRLIPEYQQISPKAKIDCLYNTVPIRYQNCYCPDAREFTMLGKLEERKGTFALLETIRDVDRHLPPDIRFNLCGDGNLEKVRSKIQELGLSHRIRHLGWAEGEIKEEILNRTMGHILFSNNEGLPMAILETMGRGIVNIATNVAAIPEVITHGTTGFLVPPGDKEALGEMILRVSRDSSLRKTVSEQGYRYIAENFSMESGAEKLEQLYASLSCNLTTSN